MFVIWYSKNSFCMNTDKVKSQKKAKFFGRLPPTYIPFKIPLHSYITCWTLLELFWFFFSLYFDSESEYRHWQSRNNTDKGVGETVAQRGKASRETQQNGQTQRSG